MSSRIRRRSVIFVGLASLGAAACASIWGFDDFSGGEPGPDAGIDGNVADVHVADVGDAGFMCDPDAQFKVKDVPGLSTLGWAVMRSATLVEDETEIFFYGKEEDAGVLHIYTAKRDDPDGGQFTGITPVTKVNDTTLESVDPNLSANGLTLFFSRRTDAKLFRSFDLYWASRPLRSHTFDSDVPLTNLNVSTEADLNPHLSFDGGELWFTSQRDGGTSHLFRAMASGAGFGPVQSVDSPNDTSKHEESPVLSADGKILFYSGDGDGAQGANDIWEARRETANAPFKHHRRVQELSGVALDYPSWLSPNGCHLYIHRTVGGGGTGTILYGDRTP